MMDNGAWTCCHCLVSPATHEIDHEHGDIDPVCLPCGEALEDSDRRIAEVVSAISREMAKPHRRKGFTS